LPLSRTVVVQGTVGVPVQVPKSGPPYPVLSVAGAGQNEVGESLGAVEVHGVVNGTVWLGHTRASWNT
jgi:hypothetical protein